MSFVIVIVTVVLPYLFAAGYIGKRSEKLYISRCHAKRSTSSCRHDHDASGFFTGAFFPIMLPVMFGAYLGERDKINKLEQKRKVELKAAEHDAQISAQKRREYEELLRLEKLQQQERELNAS